MDLKSYLVSMKKGEGKTIHFQFYAVDLNEVKMKAERYAERKGLGQVVKIVEMKEIDVRRYVA